MSTGKGSPFLIFTNKIDTDTCYLNTTTWKITTSTTTVLQVHLQTSERRTPQLLSCLGSTD